MSLVQNLVAARAGEVEGDAAAVRAEAEAVGQALVVAGKGPGVGAVEVHVDDVAGAFGDDLHEDAAAVQEELGGLEGRDAFAGGELDEGAAVKVVGPDVGGGQVVELVEGPPGAIPARLHAEKQESAVGEGRDGLPCDLVGRGDIQDAEAGAIGMDDAGLAGGGEEQARVAAAGGRGAGPGPWVRAGRGEGKRGHEAELKGGAARKHGPDVGRGSPGGERGMAK